MLTFLILLVITSLAMLLQAQIAPVYPNNYNYNNYVTYRPELNLNPTFSNLDVQTYTTPSPYAYGNLYGSHSYNQFDYRKIRIWPFVIDQYAQYPYNNNFYNNNNHYYPYNVRPTLQTYATNDLVNYWQARNQQQHLGRK